MVIGHVFKAAEKVVNKTVSKGSRIQVDKAVKTAKGIAGSRPVKQVSVYEYEALKAERQRRGRPLQGTGPRGGTTKNDKIIDKKLKEEKVKISKINKSDKKRILVGKLPVVKRKGHYKKFTTKQKDIVVKGSGVQATDLGEKRRIWSLSEELAERDGIIPISKVERRNLGKNKVSEFEERQIKKSKSATIYGAVPKGTTFWKKNRDGSKFRNNIEKLGEQTYKLSNARKWTGIGVGLGGAATLGGLGSEPSRAERNAERYLNKSKKDRWGYW